MPLARFKCSEGRDRHPHIRPIGFGCALCLCLQYFDERHLSGEHLVKIEAVGADQIGLPAAGEGLQTVCGEAGIADEQSACLGRLPCYFAREGHEAKPIGRPCHLASTR